LVPEREPSNINELAFNLLIDMAQNSNGIRDEKHSNWSCS
jgi:hypothetical protein